MLPMNKTELSSLRYYGLIGSYCTMVLSFIWLLFYFTGMICGYANCKSENARPFGRCLYFIYFDKENDKKVNFITPSYFTIMMWIGLIISLANLVISVIMAYAFTRWVNAWLVKTIATIWTISNLIFLVIELIMGIMFLCDIVIIARNDKCDSKSNSQLRSAHHVKPAEQLHSLKINLQKFKKKIRKMKKNLEFLNAIVDEKDHPEHLDNPFISKSGLKTFVEQFWNKMFHTNIYDDTRRRSDFLPADKPLKKFLSKHNINLDKVDVNLLNTFDNLTQLQCIKQANNTELRKNLEEVNIQDEMQDLKQYIKNINEKTSEFLKVDYILELMAKMYVEKLNSEIHDINDAEKFQNITAELISNSLQLANNENEEKILIYLKKFFDSILLKHQMCAKKEQLELDKEKTAKTETTAIIVTTVATTTKISKRPKVPKPPKLRISKTTEAPKVSPVTNTTTVKTTQTTKVTKRTTTEEPKIHFRSDPVNEDVCSTCQGIILGPGILFMFLALKFILFWALSMTIVVIVTYFNYQVEVVIESKEEQLSIKHH